MLKKLWESDLFKNFSYLTLAEIVSKALAFIATIHIARVLGPANYGKLGFAQAILSYFVLGVNLGFDVYSAREIAKNKNTIKELLANITVIKTLLLVVAYILLCVFILFIPRDLETKKFILFYGLTLIFPIITIDWLFQGIENFKLIAWSRIIRAIVFTLLILIGIQKSYQIYEIVLFQIVGNILGVGLLWKYVLRRNLFDLHYITPKNWGGYLKKGLILGSAFFMISVYYNLDKVMLGFWYPDRYVGWYDAAYKIVSIALTVSGILWAIFLPKITVHRTKVYVFIRIMVFFAFIWLVILTNFNELIIEIVFGKNFAPASDALFVLAFNTFLVYINIAVVSPIMLWNEKTYLQVIAMGTVTNIIFNFALIPRYAIIGAAIATCLAEVAVLASGLRPFFKEVKMEKG